MQELYVRVFGRVQMVMYRDFAARRARGLGLTGYVKNLPDGSVEVLAQGEKLELEKLIPLLKKGSMFSHVEDVSVTWREPGRRFDGFSIVY